MQASYLTILAAVLGLPIARKHIHAGLGNQGA